MENASVLQIQMPRESKQPPFLTRPDLCIRLSYGSLWSRIPALRGSWIDYWVPSGLRAKGQLVHLGLCLSQAAHHFARYLCKKTGMGMGAVSTHVSLACTLVALGWNQISQSPWSSLWCPGLHTNPTGHEPGPRTALCAVMTGKAGVSQDATCPCTLPCCAGTGNLSAFQLDLQPL